MQEAESGLKIADRRFGELSARELHDIVRLRCDVFVVEQRCPYPELDGRDTEAGTRHVWIAGNSDDADPIAAYARLLDDGGGTARIGRVVTAVKQRGEGLAAQLVDYLVASHDGDLVLDAQSYLLDWYVARGFVRNGYDFVEDGIAHTPMRRNND